jgi:hypothetical protein
VLVFTRPGRVAAQVNVSELRAAGTADADIAELVRSGLRDSGAGRDVSGAAS